MQQTKSSCSLGFKRWPLQGSVLIARPVFLQGGNLGYLGAVRQQQGSAGGLWPTLSEMLEASPCSPQRHRGVRGRG